MTTQKSNDFALSVGLLCGLLAVVILAGTALTWLVFNALGVAAWLGLGHLNFVTALGLNVLLGGLRGTAHVR